jgi:hypothetical protein
MKFDSLLMLVDFDNVSLIERKRGLKNVVERIVACLPPAIFNQGTRVEVRLYGGWYQENRLSHSAQRIAAEIAGEFPGVVPVATDSVKNGLKVTVTLARSLITNPRKELINTYRVRGCPPNLKVHPQPMPTCKSPHSCGLKETIDFFLSGCCNTRGCNTSLGHLLFKAEQKLVDTMITTDIIAASHAGCEALAVVSNDDDLWPGIQTALDLGVKVFHIHPKIGRSTPPHYSQDVSTAYKEFSF